MRAYLEVIAPTFTPATAATYRPYWRLLAAHLGDHRLGEVTITDLGAVVEDAAARATRNRAGSSGRATRETCVAALRAVWRQLRGSPRGCPLGPQPLPSDRRHLPV